MAKVNLLQGYGGREDEECRLREGNVGEGKGIWVCCISRRNQRKHYSAVNVYFFSASATIERISCSPVSVIINKQHQQERVSGLNKEQSRIY